MDGFVSGFLPGVSFITLGNLSVQVGLKNGNLTALSMSGILCVGRGLDCRKGEPNDRNIVAKVVIAKQKCAGGLVIYAKVSAVDLKRLMTIVASKNVAGKLPNFIGRCFIVLHCASLCFAVLRCASLCFAVLRCASL